MRIRRKAVASVMNKNFASVMSNEFCDERAVRRAGARGGLVTEQVSRPTLRKAVYQIIRSEYNNIRVSAVKTHIKMLTALSEMTTYTLVNKVLATGGNVILIKPLPSQVVKFLNEKVNIEKLLEESGYEMEDIIYIHLFMPHIQCFRSVDYADLDTPSTSHDSQRDSQSNQNDLPQMSPENTTLQQNKRPKINPNKELISEALNIMKNVS
ncbi:hypothetical protein ACJJTC_011535 [Scirpophaga incertulas]